MVREIKYVVERSAYVWCLMTYIYENGRCINICPVFGIGGNKENVISQTQRLKDVGVIKNFEIKEDSE